MVTLMEREGYDLLRPPCTTVAVCVTGKKNAMRNAPFGTGPTADIHHVNLIKTRICSLQALF